MPPELLQAVVERSAVVFAGAGISTEDARITGFTLQQDLAADVDMPEDSSFPDIAQRFVQKRGRPEFVRYVLNRFEGIRAMPELDSLASRFHREMATIPHFDYIMTTNWDSYFERSARALPIVIDKDFAFWNLQRRKVFKIHGSIDNVGTLIATKDDYQRRARELRRGVIGASLRLALATKTVLFFGYSMRDDDFRQVYSYLARELADLLPRSFVISPSDKPLPQYIVSRKIRTDASFFVAVLKDELVRGGHMLSGTRRPALEAFWGALQKLHRQTHEIDSRRHPAVLFATSYQDGLMHALDRALSEWATAEYHDPLQVEEQIHGYEHLRRGAVKARRYEDVAYLVGYDLGLIAIRDPLVLQKLSPFYLPGAPQIRSLAHLKRLLPVVEGRHKAAFRRAERIVRTLRRGTLWHHSATLLGVEPAPVGHKILNRSGRPIDSGTRRH